MGRVNDGGRSSRWAAASIPGRDAWPAYLTDVGENPVVADLNQRAGSWASLFQRLDALMNLVAIQAMANRETVRAAYPNIPVFGEDTPTKDVELDLMIDRSGIRVRLGTAVPTAAVRERAARERDARPTGTRSTACLRKALFAERGFYGVTVRQICSHAGTRHPGGGVSR